VRGRLTRPRERDLHEDLPRLRDTGPGHHYLPQSRQLSGQRRRRLSPEDLPGASEVPRVPKTAPAKENGLSPSLKWLSRLATSARDYWRSR
jgi:hypothetical protein